MSHPKNLDELKALGTIVCPQCSQVLDATDELGLFDHIKCKHPDEFQKLSLSVMMDDLCSTGILRKV